MSKFARRKLAADARLIVSDVFDAGILDDRARIRCAERLSSAGKFRTRLEPAVEMELVKMLEDAGVDLVVLAGFMRVLKEPMLNAFPHRIINIHPSLLPKFPGMEAWKQALDGRREIDGLHGPLRRCRNRQRRNYRAAKSADPA